MDGSGAISRPELSRLIQAAADPSEVLRKIERVVHPLVGMKKKEFLEIEAAGTWLVIHDVPLLCEGLRAQGITSGPGDLDAIILVMCPPEVQRRRCLARPEMTPEKLELILKKQMSFEDRRPYAEFVVNTAPDGLDESASFVAGRAQAAAAIAKLAERHGGPLTVLTLPSFCATPNSGWANDGRPPLACVTFDLDQTLFKINPSIMRGINRFTAVLEKIAPRTFAKTAAENVTFRHKLLSTMQDVRSEYPLIAFDFTQVRRLAITRLVT